MKKLLLIFYMLIKNQVGSIQNSLAHLKNEFVADNQQISKDFKEISALFQECQTKLIHMQKIQIPKIGGLGAEIENGFEEMRRMLKENESLNNK